MSDGVAGISLRGVAVKYGNESFKKGTAGKGREPRGREGTAGKGRN